MIFDKEPEVFNSKFEIVSCFVEFEGKILLILRQDHKPQGNTWAGPAGKVDAGESLVKAIVREVEEETGIKANEEDLVYFTKLFVKFPDYDFIYHIFNLKLDNLPSVQVNSNEHKEYVWVYPKEALGLNLMEDEDNCIKLFYNLR